MLQFRMMSNPKVLSVAASFSGQILLMAAMAVVSRVFSPEQITEYGIFFAVFNILLVTVTLRLDQAVVYAKSSEETYDLFHAGLIAIPLVSLLLAPIVYGYFARNPDTVDQVNTLTLLAVSVATLGGLARLFTQMIARFDAFLALAKLNMARPGGMAGWQILFCALGAGFVLLPLSLTLAQMCLLFYAAWLFFQVRNFEPSKFNLARIWQTIKKYKSFPLYNLPQNILFVVSEGLIPLTLSFLFTDSAAIAMFWLASRVVFAPATIFAEALRVQIYRAIAVKTSGLYRYVIKISALFAGLLTIAFVTLLLAGTFLFETVFGDGWGEANDYALVLCALVGVNMASLPFVGTLPLLKMQAHLMWVEVAGLALRAALLFGFDWPDSLTAVTATTIGYILLMLGFMIYTSINLRRYEAETK